MPSYNTKTSSSIIMILPTLVIYLLCSVALASGPPVQNIDSLTGIWTGIITDEKDGEIKTDLTIEGTEGSYQYTLDYGSPRSCDVKAEELPKKDNLITLRINNAYGNFCDKLYKGLIIITIIDENHLSVQIENKSGKIKETAALEKKIVYEEVQEEK